MLVKHIFLPVKKNEKSAREKKKSGREKRQILVKKCRDNHFLPLKKSKNRPKMAFTGTKLFIFTENKNTEYAYGAASRSSNNLSYHSLFKEVIEDL